MSFTSTNVNQKYCLILFKEGDKHVTEDARYHVDSDEFRKYISDGMIKNRFYENYTLFESTRQICVLTQTHDFFVEKIEWFATLDNARKKYGFDIKNDDFKDGVCYDDKFVVYNEAREVNELDELPGYRKNCLLLYYENGKITVDRSGFFKNNVRFRHYLKRGKLDVLEFPEGYDIYQTDKSVCVIIETEMKYYFFDTVKEAEKSLNFDSTSLTSDNHMLYNNKIVVFTKALDIGDDCLDEQTCFDKKNYLVIYKDEGEYIGYDPTGFYQNTRGFREALRNGKLESISHSEGFDIYGTDDPIYLIPFKQGSIANFKSFKSTEDARKEHYFDLDDMGGDEYVKFDNMNDGIYIFTKPRTIKAEPLTHKYYLVRHHIHGNSIFVKNDEKLSKFIKDEELDFIGSDKPVCVIQHEGDFSFTYRFYDSVEDVEKKNNIRILTILDE